MIHIRSLLGSSYKKNAYKKFQIFPSFTLRHQNLLKPPKNA